MSPEAYKPRRPAMLEPEQAEQIPGDEDPAITTSAALTSARALLGFGDDEFTEDQVHQLGQVITTEGVDTVSALWSRSSALSLPGQLWRLYLLSEWTRRASDVVRDRYDEGVAAIRASERGANLELPDLDRTIASVRKLMSGNGIEDLPALLADSGRLLRVLAAGASYGPNWIESDSSELADSVTRRAGALLRTSDELLEGAKMAARDDYL